MRRALLICCATAFALPFAAPAAAGKSEACREERGRIQLTNGTPSLRIFTANGRTLGVHDRDGAAEFDLARELPAGLRGIPLQAYWEGRVSARMTVCARDPQRPGRMQSVRIVRAAEVSIKPVRIAP